MYIKSALPAVVIVVMAGVKGEVTSFPLNQTYVRAADQTVQQFPAVTRHGVYVQRP